MSAHMTVLGAMEAAIVAAVPAAVARHVEIVTCEEEFEEVKRGAPSVGIMYRRRAWEKPRVQGRSAQASDWTFQVRVYGRKPGPTVPSGHDLFTLLEACETALRGLQVPALPGVRLFAVDEDAGERLATAQEVVQEWATWRALT